MTALIKARLLRITNGLLDERAPAPSRAQKKEEQARQRAYAAAARARCREFMELRYCAACHLALDVADSFCGTCNSATEPLPADFALAYARDEFPDLVETRDDFDRLIE